MILERVSEYYYNLPKKGCFTRYDHMDGCWVLRDGSLGPAYVLTYHGSLEAVKKAFIDSHPEYNTNLHKLLRESCEPTLIGKLKRLFYDE